MWLLRKAGEIIAPTASVNTLKEFKSECSRALDSLKTHSNDDILLFQGALQNIQDYLQVEINNDDIPCFGYLSEMNILQKISDSLTPNVPAPFIDSVFRFFLDFLKSELKCYFVQVSVHGPFSSLVGKMELFYQSHQPKLANLLLRYGI